MNYRNLLKIALKALRRNKFRAFLTMLGIIIGVTSVIAMLAIGQGSKKSIQDQVSGMGSNLIMIMPGGQFMGGVHMGNSDSKNLTFSDMEAIKQECPSIIYISPEVRGNGQVIYANQNTPTSIYGVNENYPEIKKVTIKSGRMFYPKEIKSAAKVCIVGKTVVKNLFGENANPLGRVIRFNNIPLKIIGVLSEKGQNTFGMDQDDLILAPYTTVQKRILAISHIQSILSSAVSEDKSEQAVSEIESVLRRRHKIKDSEENDFDVRTQEELVKTLGSISDMLTILLGAIASISLLVGGIGIMNIMYVSVTERTREIGLRMSVGGRGIDILIQFLTEAVLLSVTGGILGILLGIISSKIISSVMNWPVIVTSQSVIVSFVVCTVVGVFFGWYPARKAAKLNPIDALRYE